MQRDIRANPWYPRVAEHFRRSTEPALGEAAGVEDLSASSDGRRLAVTTIVYERLSGAPVTRIDLIDVRSGSRQRLGSERNSDRAPQFSPDGKRLAFLSDRAEEGRFQLYLAEPETFERTMRAPAVDGIVESFEWSADGKRILLQTAGMGADLAGAQGSGTRAHEPDDLPSWMPLVEEATPSELWRRLWILSIEDGSVNAILATSQYTSWEARWCGLDGVVAVVSDDPREGAWYGARLEHVDLQTGAKTVLHADSLDQIGLPRATPSGRYVAALQACCSDRMVIAGDVVLVDRVRGIKRRLDTAGVDVSSLAFRDESTLFFIGLRGFESVAGNVDLESGRTSILWRTRATTGGGMYPDAVPLSGTAFAALVHAYGRFPTAVIVDGGEERVVRDFAHAGTEYVRDVGGKLEEIVWRGRDGLEVDGYLALPPVGNPHPLVVLVHGGPVWAFRNAWSMSYVFTPLLVRNGYAVLHPNPRGSGGRGQEYARKVRGDVVGEDTFDILAGVDLLVKRGLADPTRLAITGRSYGGQMASWMITQTDRFAAAVPMAPVTDNLSAHFTTNIPDYVSRFLDGSPYDPTGPYAARSPVMFARNVKTPTLNVAGALDRCTPPGQALEFHRALLENGVPSELVVYPEEGHHVEHYETQIDLCTRMLSWLGRYLHVPATALD